MGPAAHAASAALTRALGVLLPAQDILDGRVDEPEPPGWCEARGWSGFLLSLDDGALRRCEAEGLAAVAPQLAGAPEGLLALARGVEQACLLPALREELAPPREAMRSVGARKQRQLGRLLGAVASMARGATRIVDVGAGAGHFTRLAAEMFDRDALGVDRDEGLLQAAEALRDARARQGAEGARRARFEALDACRDPILLRAGDLAVGLHACGAVGDRLVEAAALAGSGLALVSCCFQKVPTDTRAPLSRAGAGLVLRREILGLANLTSRPEGVEASLEQTLAARQARFALHRLLRGRGVQLSPGEAMRGINRRRAHGGLGALAAAALAARGLAAATDEELRRHEAEAARQYGAVRRLALPRHMLARLVEVAVVLDRAAALEEAGLVVRVLTVCDRADTPRNVCIFAGREEARLPRPGAGMW